MWRHIHLFLFVLSKRQEMIGVIRVRDRARKTFEQVQVCPKIGSLPCALGAVTLLVTTSQESYKVGPTVTMVNRENIFFLQVIHFVIYFNLLIGCTSETWVRIIHPPRWIRPLRRDVTHHPVPIFFSTHQSVHMFQSLQRVCIDDILRQTPTDPTEEEFTRVSVGLVSGIQHTNKHIKACMQPNGPKYQECHMTGESQTVIGTSLCPKHWFMHLTRVSRKKTSVLYGWF